MKRWLDWYSYEVCEYVIQYFQLAESTRLILPHTFEKFVDALTDAGPLAAALSFRDFSTDTKKKILFKLYRSCNRIKKLQVTESFQRERPCDLQDGLRQASALALSLGLRQEALGISLHVTTRRPGIWSLRDHFNLSDDVFPFVFRAGLVAAAKNRILHEKDVIAEELVPVCVRISRQIAGKDFRDKVKSVLPKFTRNEREKTRDKPEPNTLSPDQKREAERFLDYQLEPLLALTRAFAKFLSSPRRSAAKAFGEVLMVWKDARKNRDPYNQSGHFDRLFRFLGFQVALFALRVRTDLMPSSVKSFLAIVHSQNPSPRMLVEIVALLARRKALHAIAGEQAVYARKLIELEDEVTQRASLFADLGRAILPASIDEASVHFRDGLEQMDAIGSGDYEFTNELLLFAAAMKGSELDESDFHTLTNICELNMPEETGKFVWCAFGKGMSKAAGVRGLAKLGRWDDRSKIDLAHTLLPYLTALVADGKIEPEAALCLNRLASPIEFWYCGTKEFAEAIGSNPGAARPDVIAELIQQYEDDCHKPYGPTVETLSLLAGKTLGETSETTTYLSAVYKREAGLRDTQSNKNYRDVKDARQLKRLEKENSQIRSELQAIAAATDTMDPASLGGAISAATNLGHIFDFKGEFLAALRARVPFNRRAEYLRHLCALQTFHFPWKLAELNDCKASWSPSTASLGAALKNQAAALVKLHADDLISDGSLSGSSLNGIADLTGVPIGALVLELIKTFAQPDSSIPGTVWLSLASFVVEEADDGQGQLALSRLLRSEAARRTNSVIDGAWRSGLYPEDDEAAIAAGLLWRLFGSPHAESRWRAAHSSRCFARFGYWNIIDTLVGKLANEKSAGPFQADELTFYFLHAQLWLLIALARMALDHPREVTRYQNTLLRVAEESHEPHVLMRHFAARALLACIDAGDLDLPPEIVARLRRVDISPYPPLKQKTKTGGGFYQGRPASAKKSKYKFDLDYDFHKYDVDNLSSVFGKPLWEVEEMMSEVVQKLAPTATSMYESDGRLSLRRAGYRGIVSSYHSNGQQLGWHALFFAAGRLLRDSPVTADWRYEEDPWGEWLSRYVLTRDDGLWLSDGVDRRPLDTESILLEKGKKTLALTGDREKLLKLVGISPRIGKELVVEGSWRSADNIRVRISSALVPHENAQRLARRLTREDPMRVWLPIYSEDDKGGEYLQSNRNEYGPWVVGRSGDARLDEDDPFGTSGANSRPRVSRDYAQTLSLTSADPFSRIWYDKRKKVAVRAQVWGRENKDSEDGPDTGLRLLCSMPFLKTVLGHSAQDLLILVKLERYESKTFQESAQFSHSIAVVRVTKALEFEYFPGRVNHVFKSQF
ncbi:MAG TPA: hypothetical protein VGS22_29395 [Thermoanaerobaculia bacterium]|nr:hypothetical protein [Thermoanaerobaculia bacterium]